MIDSELRELVSLVMNESMVKSFNWNEFRRIDNPRFAFQYVSSKELQCLGSGSGRTTFRISSKKVIKLATNMIDSGMSSNRLEFKTSAMYQPFVARTFTHSPSFSWIISELVRPLTDRTEFKRLLETNFGVTNLRKIVIEILNHDFNEEDQIDVDRNFIQFLKSLDSSTLADCSGYKQWGMTANGRLVLVDYGE